MVNKKGKVPQLFRMPSHFHSVRRTIRELEDYATFCELFFVPKK